MIRQLRTGSVSFSVTLSMPDCILTVVVPSKELPNIYCENSGQSCTIKDSLPNPKVNGVSLADWADCIRFPH